MATPKYAFAVAVIGDESVMSAEDLWRLLDLLVNRHRDDRRIMLLSPGGMRESRLWAEHWRYSIALVANTEGPVKHDCELLAKANAIVVLGDPGPWRRLMWLAGEANVPVRVFQERPKRMPVMETPAWEVTSSSRL